MIHEDDDGHSAIDFSWFYFIGLKIGLSVHETGRLTLWMFNKLYQHYKDNWDLEMRLRSLGLTYAETAKRVEEDEEWF